MSARLSRYDNDAARRSDKRAELTATIDRLAESIDRLRREFEKIEEQRDARSDDAFFVFLFGGIVLGALVGTVIGRAIADPLRRIDVVETRWKDDP